MKKLFWVLIAVVISSLVLWSCQKELSVETGATPSNPATTPFTTYGWQFNGGSTPYSGCIDTAFYTTISGASFLRIEGSDNSGNFFYIIVTAPNGKAAKGTYLASQGQSSTVISIGSKNYTLNSSNIDFKAEITDITDTTVNISFSGTLLDQASQSSLTVTQGKLKALIGKENPCSGSGTGGGGTTGSAVFTLTTVGTGCSSFAVGGTYSTNNPTTTAEKVTLQVTVTTAGTYSLQTATVNGFSFSGSGTFTNTGAQFVTLQASGTPTAAGTTNFPISAGTTNCNFSVNVTAGTATPYAFSFLDSNINKTFAGPDTALIGTYGTQKVLSIIGGFPPSYDSLLEIDIVLPNGVIETTTYTAPGDQAYFAVIDTSANPKYFFETDPSLSETKFTVTITAHDPTTKTIIGTFRAVARKDETVGQTHVIKNGTFKARYQ